MQMLMEILVSFFLLTGSFFLLVGGVGMVRLPDLFMRLHAPTKASTLGLGSFLIASMIYAAFQFRFGFAELLLTLFAFITAPVSANLLAQAAIHLNLRSRSGNVPEAINRPLPWERYKKIPYIFNPNKRNVQFLQKNHPQNLEQIDPDDKQC